MYVCVSCVYGIYLNLIIKDGDLKIYITWKLIHWLKFSSEYNCLLLLLLLHSPGSARWLTPIRNSLHYFRLTSALLGSSVTFSMILAAVSSFSTSCLNISLYTQHFAHVFLLLQGMFGGCVSGFLFLLCTVCRGCLFCIVFMMISHWQHGYYCPYYYRALFPVQFLHVVGLLAILISVLGSFQCFTFVFSMFSFSIKSRTLVFISSWRCFLDLV